jgi:membrane fusion protein (multidrug efflux system)
VSGYLVRQAYTEGAPIKRGDLLFEIDPRPFQNAADQAAAKLRQAESLVVQARSQVSASEAQVEQAKAVVAQAEADIKRAEANQRKTELDVARYTPLAERGSVSQQELDDAVQANLANLAAVAAARASLLNAEASVLRARASLEKAQADVEQAHADVAAARAALAEAQLNLGYTRVIAPIAGIAGFRVANIGDLVGPGDQAPLTTVSQVDPMYVQFPVSEQVALRVRRRWQSEPAAPRTLTLELILADGSVYEHAGKAEILDRQVDVTTGTVLARAVFPNPGNVLRPGQYAKVRGVTEVKKDALLVPQRTVIDQQGLHLVAVVEANDTVALRPVKMGERVGALWIVAEGLKPGDRIVSEGADKVKAGEKVKPVPVG